MDYVDDKTASEIVKVSLEDFHKIRTIPRLVEETSEGFNISDVLRLKRILEVLPTISSIKSKIDAVSLEEAYKNTIKACLLKYSYNQARVSKELGISRSTLWRKMNEFGL